MDPFDPYSPFKFLISYQSCYIDTCLPFGLHSTPCIFNRLATAIHWILQSNYNVQFLLHYLDGFLTAGPPDSLVCQQNLESHANPLSMNQRSSERRKSGPPSTKITFLGIVIDTVAMTASISDERKSLMLEKLQSFTTCKKCTKQQLLSLIGKLSFACKVVPAGRIFLCRLVDLSMTVQRFHHHIRISQEARLDIIWWLDFLPTWPGSSLVLDTHWTSGPSMNLYTDASGSEGWGAFWCGRWLQAGWSLAQSIRPILWKELFAVVNAINMWGHQWAKQKILLHCDNEAVVEIWHKGSTHNTETMALVLGQRPIPSVHD